MNPIDTFMLITLVLLIGWIGFLVHDCEHKVSAGCNMVSR